MEQSSYYMKISLTDMVVGSYLSDNAVVIFGKPVIHVGSDLNVINSRGSSTDIIEANGENKESVLVCFQYYDRRCNYVSEYITMTF